MLCVTKLLFVQVSFNMVIVCQNDDAKKMQILWKWFVKSWEIHYI